jgi:transposase-like protein
METPRTLQEAITYFADSDRAREFVVALRWPNGVACPRYGCGSAYVQWIGTRKLWRCKECKRQFTAKVGTVFEDSPIGFEKWLPAFWLLSSAKNGISSYELHRALGVTQKTAWFMLHRIRLAMKTKTFERLHGEVEADETFIGEKLRNKHRAHRHVRSGKKSTGPVGKTPILGIMQRGKSAAGSCPMLKKPRCCPK